MKVNKLILKMYKAIIKDKRKSEKNRKAEKKLYMKALKKSLKHKHTQAIQ